MVVLTYFNKLKILWEELDIHQYWEMESAKDATKLAEILERVFEFLAGLKPKFDEMRSRILGKEHVPSLHDFFSSIQDKESKKIIMMGEANSQEHSALKASRENNGWNKKTKDEHWCDFCNRLNHIKETCWKLHGKPTHMEGKPQFNNKGKNKAKTSKGFHVESTNQQASESSTSTAAAKNSLFSKEQPELLYKLGKIEVIHNHLVPLHNQVYQNLFYARQQL